MYVAPELVANTVAGLGLLGSIGAARLLLPRWLASRATRQSGTSTPRNDAPAPRPAPAPKSNTGFDDMDDDIPF